MDAPANSIISGPTTSIFNAMRFDENPFTCQCEKEDKKAYSFQISHFSGAFSNHIMAVKGLKLSTIKNGKTYISTRHKNWYKTLS